MIRASTPGTTSASPRARDAGLLGRALAGIGSILDVIRETQQMRNDAQRRYPSMES